jgi:hypothetical protein
MDGLQRLFDFTNFLNDHKIIHKIEQTSPSRMMVTFATAGQRVEVYFTTDEATYSIFTGNEDEFDDMETVTRLVEEFCRD